jgi:diaminopimelate decarboxylase
LSSPVRGTAERAARTTFKRILRGLAHQAAPPREDLPLSTWGLSRTASGELALRGFGLRRLLAEPWGSPVHVVDVVRLEDNAKRFCARPAGAGSACEVYYSYKTNPVPGVLRRLHDLGVGAEVASEYELWLALRLGVDPAAIVYNGPGHSQDSLELAVRREIGLINLNARSEIAPLAALARRFGKKPRIGIRVVAPGFQGGQFGERIDGGAALYAFNEALRAPELRVVALHSHGNGSVRSAGEVEHHLTGLLSFADELREKLGLRIEILDVGGNLACPTVEPFSKRTQRLATTFGCEPAAPRPGTVLTIDEYVTLVASRVEQHYTSARLPPPRIFLEPGRALTGDAQMLLCRVTSVHDPDEQGLVYATLDAGINVAESARGEFHQLFPLMRPSAGPERLYRLSGPSCTLGDQIYYAWRLPVLAPGDGLAIMDSGAYFVPYSTCFSRPRPAVVAVADGGLEVLRRAETFDDLVALDEAALPARVARIA